MQRVRLYLENELNRSEQSKEAEEIERLRAKIKSLLTILSAYGIIPEWQYEILLLWGDLKDA